jgi:hypothetical protein
MIMSWPLQTRLKLFPVTTWRQSKPPFKGAVEASLRIVSPRPPQFQQPRSWCRPVSARPDGGATARDRSWAARPNSDENALRGRNAKFCEHRFVSVARCAGMGEGKRIEFSSHCPESPRILILTTRGQTSQQHSAQLRFARKEAAHNPGSFTASTEADDSEAICQQVFENLFSTRFPGCAHLRAGGGRYPPQ